MTSVRDLVAREERLLAASRQLRGIHADAVQRARAAVIALQQDGGIDIDEAEARLGPLCAELLDDYASRAAALVAEQDLRAWRELASTLPSDSPFDPVRTNDLLRAHGTPGAARLLAAVESVRGGAAPSDDLDRSLAAAAGRCVCGYAKTRVVPKRLCQPCATAVATAWEAEEQRLLQGASGLRAETVRILDEARSAIAKARAIGTDDAYSTEEALLFKTRRALARANRRHRDEVSRLDLTRWRELAALTARASMPTMAGEARRARRRLGMAQLSRLALRGRPGAAR